MRIIFNIGYNLENSLSLEILLGPRHFSNEERAALEEVTDSYYSSRDLEWEKFIDNFHEPNKGQEKGLKIWEAPYKKL